MWENLNICYEFTRKLSKSFDRQSLLFLLRYKTPTRVFGKGPMCHTINGSGRVNAKLVQNPCIPFHPLIVGVGKKLFHSPKIAGCLGGTMHFSEQTLDWHLSTSQISPENMIGQSLKLWTTTFVLAFKLWHWKEFSYSVCQVANMQISKASCTKIRRRHFLNAVWHYVEQIGTQINGWLILNKHSPLVLYVADGSGIQSLDSRWPGPCKWKRSEIL